VTDFYYHFLSLKVIVTAQVGHRMTAGGRNTATLRYLVLTNEMSPLFYNACLSLLHRGI